LFLGESLVVLERLARLGYACIGIVYIIVGGLTVMAALGQRRSAGDRHDALTFILQLPFGRVALIVVIAGLAGYALWRVLSGIKDTEHRGTDAKGLALRAGSIGRGAVYAVFAFEVVRLLQHHGSGDHGDASTRHWTARLMDMPFGRALVAAAGLAVIGYGAYQLWAAWDKKLGKRLRLGEIDARVRDQVVAVSRIGIGGRGLVFLIIGASLLRAAWRHNPNDAHSTSGALQQWPYVGIGLIAYGVYAIVNARYRRIET
jgi:hypothetical protein